jgi:hypothetical protein
LSDAYSEAMADESFSNATMGITRWVGKTFGREFKASLSF